uniref:Uncharacterized protein n=1 Tax=Fagus sylvatica TaxID=28930 RepID=A0A2N9FMZ0_FAGSY
MASIFKSRSTSSPHGARPRHAVGSFFSLSGLLDYWLILRRNIQFMADELRIYSRPGASYGVQAKTTVLPPVGPPSGAFHLLLVGCWSLMTLVEFGLRPPSTVLPPVGHSMMSIHVPCGVGSSDQVGDEIVPALTLIVTFPDGMTVSPENPLSGPSVRLKSFFPRPKPLNNDSYMISTELPGSMRTLFTSNSPIRRVITKASEWGRGMHSLLQGLGY